MGACIKLIMKAQEKSKTTPNHQMSPNKGVKKPAQVTYVKYEKVFPSPID